MKRIVLTIAVLAISAATLTAETTLEVNTWTPVTKQDLGARENAAVIWLEKQNKFMVICGLRGGFQDAGGAPFEIQTFAPGDKAWKNYFPEGKEGLWGTKDGPSKAPKFKSVGDQFSYICSMDTEKNRRLEPVTAVSDCFAFDPLAEKVYIILTTHHGHNELEGKRLPLFSYDVASRAWKYLGDTPPPVDTTSVYGKVKLGGTSIAFDPINKQMLFLGGHCPGAPKGTVGDWSLSPESGEWTQLTVSSGVLDPLFEKAVTAKTAMRDAMAYARNVFYKSLPATEESKLMQGLPAQTAAQAVTLVAALLAEVNAAKGQGWEKDALSHAAQGLDTALEKATVAAKDWASGTVTAETLKAAFDAAWQIDEAADYLRSTPGPRKYASTAYDVLNQSVMLFGGEHGDFLYSDTWAYDCVKKSWRRLFPDKAPPPRAGASMFWLPSRKAVCLMGGGTYVTRFTYHDRSYAALNDCWTLDTASGKWSAVAEITFDIDDKKARKAGLKCNFTAGTGDVILGLAYKSYGYRKGQAGNTWMLKLGSNDDALTAKLGVPGNARLYLSIVKEYNPAWYDAAPRGDHEKSAAFLAGLQANAWTPVPRAPRPCPQRDWGTALFDAKRDQFYHWTGGHMADPATIVSTYHPGINRWSIPFVGEYMGGGGKGSSKGISFNGRPDCGNHTYLNYAFDLKTDKMVCLSSGGTSIYNPDRRDFEAHLPLPFNFAQYYTKAVGTRDGVVAWDRGYLGILDVEKRTWTKLPWEGILPNTVHGDCNSMAYDSKRNCIWMGSTKTFSLGTGQMWKYDMTARALSKANPKNIESAKWMTRIRESLYVPKLDLVLFNIFNNNKQVAYDPAGNRWVTLNIPKSQKGLGGVGIAMMRDPKRDVIWSVDNGQRMYVLKIDPKALEITEDICPGPEEERKGKKK
jgi:hypothetical protein